MPRRKLYKSDDFARLGGRLPENPNPEGYRSEFRRDYARLIHSPCFCRLQGKTQLFPSHESDFYRNRLTHSLEVAQIAKSIAIRLNSTEPIFRNNPIDLDLVEFAALAHDIGHPPFGHTGEAQLDSLMIDDGGFEGNAQTLRLLSKLEKKATHEFPRISHTPTAVIDGLNPQDRRLGIDGTVRSLASVLKYDQVIPQSERARKDKKCHERPCK